MDDYELDALILGERDLDLADRLGEELKLMEMRHNYALYLRQANEKFSYEHWDSEADKKEYDKAAREYDEYLRSEQQKKLNKEYITSDEAERIQYETNLQSEEIEGLSSTSKIPRPYDFKQKAFYRDYVRVDRKSWRKVGLFGGWQLLSAYYYLLLHHDSQYVTTTNMKMICEWMGVKKAKLVTVKKLLLDLVSLEEIDIADSEVLSLSKTLRIVMLPPSYPFDYFYIRKDNHQINELKTGHKLFALYCCMESAVYYRQNFREVPAIDRQSLISQAALADLTHLSRNTVKKSIDDLIEAKYIAKYTQYSKNERKFLCSIYTLYNHTGRTRRIRNKSTKHGDESDEGDAPVDLGAIGKAINLLVNLDENEYPVILSGPAAHALWDYYKTGTANDKLGHKYRRINPNMVNVSKDEEISCLEAEYWISKMVAKGKYFFEECYSSKLKEKMIIPVWGVTGPINHSMERLYSYYKDFIIINLGSYPEHQKVQFNTFYYFTLLDETGKSYIR